MPRRKSVSDAEMLLAVAAASRLLPRFLGVWLALAGFAWVILCFTGIVLPQYVDTMNTYCQPAILGEIAFMLWLVIKGARPPQLDAAAR